MTKKKALNKNLKLESTIYRFRFFVIFVAIMIIIIAAINISSIEIETLGIYFYQGIWLIFLILALIRLYVRPKYKYSGSLMNVNATKTVITGLTVALCFLFLKFIIPYDDSCSGFLCFDLSEIIPVFGTLFLLPILIFIGVKLSDYFIKRKVDME